LKSGRYFKFADRPADIKYVEPGRANALKVPAERRSDPVFHTRLSPTMSTTTATRFLIVDDFSTMRRILRNLLAELGFRQVDEATDGRIALELMQSNHFDFIISDVHMPNVNGFELLQRIRADVATRDTPVLLVTGEARKDDFVQAARLGANGIITKPLTKSALEEKVRNILLSPLAWPGIPSAPRPEAHRQAIA